MDFALENVAAPASNIVPLTAYKQNNKSRSGPELIATRSKTANLLSVPLAPLSRVLKDNVLGDLNDLALPRL